MHTADGTGIERRFGSNRPCRPVKIGSTRSVRDTITPLINKNPFIKTAVVSRIWLPGAKKFADAGRLAGEANYVLTQAAERAGYPQLMHGFVDAGPQFDAAKFEGDVIDLARLLGIAPAWSDQALSDFLDKALDLGRIKGINASNRRAWAALMDRMVVHQASKTAKRS